MTDRQDWEQPPQYPQQGYGQQSPQDQPWQWQQYDPYAHQQRVQRMQRVQRGQAPQYPPQQRYGQPPAPPRQPQHRGRSRAPLYAGLAALVVIAGGGAAYALAGHGTPASTGSTSSTTTPASSAAAQPDASAGVRAVAQQFYALYSASQWAAAWDDLAPSAQSAVTVATWTAVHNGCPSQTAGMARVIKSVTVAGTTAVVAETVAGSLGNLATVSDAWTYSGGRWGFSPSAGSMSIYKHGSATADIAAAKAAGDCAS
jgi:hypothetical protein